ncbi:MAG: hypothetical protein L6R38_006935 [Xanthoria sp. 2 TBL-2021]|nr:MAG: hypothetical protein L6R38_006935 [Xanthoria sp. 2 TBL-2021]
MHPDDEVYFVEKRARRQRYEHAGVDGRLLAKNALKGQPEKLFVGFDVDEMVGRVVGMLHKKEFARVLFLHVPETNAEASVKRGVDIATALVTACVDSLPGDYKKNN